MKPASPDPVAVAVDLLDTVADSNVDDAIADLEALLHRLRTTAADSAAARARLHQTPVPLLREAILRRASRPSVPE